jgi:oligopeptide transport system ATP-binding protein
MSGPLLSIEDLKVHFPFGGGLFGRNRRAIRAVDGASLTLEAGETLGLVGESGCGKSTLSNALVRIVEPTAGRVLFEGVDIALLDRAALRQVRRRIALVFQDPFSALNPRMRIGDSIAEPLVAHRLLAGQALRDRVGELLRLVGLASEHASRYPHQFSGGQRQRVVIARALASEPSLLLCDEPVSALDVSVRSQILNLLLDLQARFGMAILFVSHDLSVVRHVCDRIAVMYLGRIVEQAERASLFEAPAHPYTRGLIDAVPPPDPALRKGQGDAPIAGEIPSPADPPPGCHFHPRCPFVIERCRHEPPRLRPLASGALVACHRAEEVQAMGASERHRNPTIPAHGALP